MQGHRDDAEVTGSGYRRPWVLYAVAALLVVAVAVGVAVKFGHPGPAAPVAAPSPSVSSSSHPVASHRPAPPFDRLSAEPPPLVGDGWLPTDRNRSVQGQNAGASCDHEVPGLLLRDSTASETQSRTVCSPGVAPSSIVVRDVPGGFLGHRSAVLTYPVAPPLEGAGPARTHDGLRGWWFDGGVAWRVGGQDALVRGDLPQRTLARLALAFRLDSYGGLELDRVAGTAVSHQALYDGVADRTALYPAWAVGLQQRLGRATVFTRVTSGSEVEDRILRAGAQPVGTVHGHPAVVSRWSDHYVVLAWELEPGITALVGYRTPGTVTVTAPAGVLHAVAARTVVVGFDRWELGNAP